jgi:DNA recombination protein RmuC
MTVEVALLLFNVVLLLAVLAISVILFSRRSAAPDLTLLATRADVERSERSARDGVGETRTALAEEAKRSRDELASALERVASSNEKRLGDIRETVDARLRMLQEDNAQKLEQMRATVDEKLQSTLELRLGESFKLVSDRLEQVHRGLGEMQVLAEGVGDLKKVLTNVKSRGTWGEVQLGALLEQVLSPEQYAANVSPKGEGREVVEFAVKLPGQEGADDVVWLPIDSKFPVEDYIRLTEAQDAADREAVEEAAKAMEARVRMCAKDIRDKYIAPPKTTDFGVLFLPTEGLYAEVLRRPGLVEALQRDYRVCVAGPTTLGAFLNSLRMGFRTLAIQKRSSEVWTVLSGVKTEFSKFGGVLDKVGKKLQEASNVVEKVSTRTRAIERKLRNVETLPVAEGELPMLIAELPEESKQLS